MIQIQWERKKEEMKSQDFVIKTNRAIKAPVALEMEPVFIKKRRLKLGHLRKITRSLSLSRVDPWPRRPFGLSLQFRPILLLVCTNYLHLSHWNGPSIKQIRKKWQQSFFKKIS